ncbi:hypothetical protein [Longispora albida]|uniref:hypothetical protein n=1 Tax=Longispora albida TaxID=203523 RepID=UPI000371C178|nr:hypothetical protein [Longispora albida]
MTMSTEKEIRAAFGSAEELAPKPEPGLRAAVEQRYRRRRAAGRTATGSLAALVAAGVVIASTMVSSDGDRSPSAGPSAGPSAAASPAKAVTVTTPMPWEQVWPGSLKQLPATLPDGGKYYPKAAIDATKWVVIRVGGTPTIPGSSGELLVFDTAAGTTRRVVDAKVQGDDLSGISRVTAGDGYLAYATTTSMHTAVWVVPAAGGTPRKVTEYATGSAEPSRSLNVDGLVVAGGRVAWAVRVTAGPDGEDGVWTAPLTGGSPALVPDSKGWELTNWPWITKEMDRDNPGPAFLRNLETGAHKAVQPPPGARMAEMHCSPGWCSGWREDKSTFIMRSDGSGLQEGMSIPGGRQIVADRYLFGSVLRGTQPRDSDLVVWDLQTGKVGLAGSPDPKQSGDFTWNPGDNATVPLLCWRTPDWSETSPYAMVDFGRLK